MNDSTTPSHNLNEKLIITVLFFVQFTHMVDFVVMMPLGPKLVRAFSLTPTQFSYVISSYAFAAALSGLISSFFVDNYDRKRVLLFFYSGFLFANMFCALSVNYPMLVISRILAGGFGGVLAGLTFSIIGDVVPEFRRGKATGIVMSAFGTASVVGIPLGLYLADHYDWHSPFWFISALSMLVIVVTAMKMPKITGHIKLQRFKKSEELTKIMNLFRDANCRGSFMLSCSYIISGFLVIPFISQYLVRNVKLLENQLSLTYFFGGLFTLFTSRIIGTMSDKYGKHRMLYILAPLSLVPIYMMTNLSAVPLAVVLTVSTSFFILISGRFVPVMAIVTSSVAKANRGAFMGINSSLQQMSMGLASVVAGFVIKYDVSGEILHFNFVGYLSMFMTLVFIYLASKVKIID
ncbi:MAG: MFS transporter [Bacteriovorax sp.]|jgi:predicted MFS family arabinose efflux permease